MTAATGSCPKRYGKMLDRPVEHQHVGALADLERAAVGGRPSTQAALSVAAASASRTLQP